MVLALAATALVALALTSDLIIARVEESWRRMRARRKKVPTLVYDPGRELRAEQRARDLLRSCIGEEEWGMYRDLGFIRVWGTQSDGPDEKGGTGGAAYAYLIYPHRPIVAYLAQTHRLLGEYCVAFPDETRPYIYGASWVLRPAAAAVNDVSPFLRKVERLAKLPAAKAPDLGHAEDVLDHEDEMAAIPGVRGL